MKKLHVAIVGAGGRMGQELMKVLAEDPLTIPAVGVTRDGNADGFGRVVRSLEMKEFKNIQLVIDFSSLENLKSVAEFCAKNSLPLVCGTTGLDADHMKALKKASGKIPVLWAPNMSLGVAALVDALKALGGLEGFDFQIEEIHHNKKIDTPSGTAKFLQKELEKNVKKKCPAPVALRGGGVFGVHKVYAFSQDEVLVFEHQALNRRLFAVGAVKAGKWLVHQKAGLFEIRDVIGKR